MKKFILSDVKIFTTQNILDETAEVLERDFEYNKNEAKNIIEKILLFASLIQPKQKIDIIKDDPDEFDKKQAEAFYNEMLKWR